METLKLRFRHRHIVLGGGDQAKTPFEQEEGAVECSSNVRDIVQTVLDGFVFPS